MRNALIALLFIAAPLVAQEAPQLATPASQSEDFTRAVVFGKNYFDLKEYALAYDYFAKAAALQPDNAAVLYDLALILARAGRYAEAQTKIDRYLQVYPNGAEKQLVTRLQLSLDFQRELQKNRQVAQEYQGLFTRGRFLYVKNDLDAALKLFEQAEQQRPTDPAAVYNQAVIYDTRGDLAKAAERFHRYQELESDADLKAATDQHILLIESELEDMHSKIVCPFCGLRLPIGATWCHRCWHGPYLTAAPLWSSRPCIDGASATRNSYYFGDRFAKAESLPCISAGGTLLEALRYTPARQKAIQDARRAEGWTYNGEIIQGQGTQIRYTQGPQYLERVTAPANGDVLAYTAHKAGEVWLLDREEMIIDGQKYVSRYTFDGQNRIATQQVDYQNANGCNHVISMTADYTYTNDALTAVAVKGGYDGYVVEGQPRVDWTANVAYTYDQNARVTKEELSVASMSKTYMAKPQGAARDEVNRLYPTMRVKRPIENVLRTGDVCATNGNLMLGNQIDLRPFYAMSPNVAMLVPYGVTQETMTFTYPDSYKVR
jgi:Flp pilus assembly protein TadD/ribosomal protein L40E